MTDLILPDRLAPSSLRLAPSMKARYVEGDLYDIAARLREMHPSVYAVELEKDGSAAWAIMEDCEDGVQRLIFKVKALDGRVLEKLARIMAVPLAERIRIAEQEEYRAEETRKENELEKLYEEVGRPMWTELENCGFIQRNLSFAKTGVARGRRYAR